MINHFLLDKQIIFIPSMEWDNNIVGTYTYTINGWYQETYS